MKKKATVNVLFAVRKGVCGVAGRFNWGFVCPPMRPVNNPFLREKGRAAFVPTWKRAAAFMGEAIEHELIVMQYYIRFVAKAEPLDSVVAGWRYFQPNSLPPAPN